MAGFGSRAYYSQLFWQQNLLSGLFVELFGSAGYAHEHIGDSGNPYEPRGETKRNGAVFSLEAGLGYSHAFDMGLCLGVGANIALRNNTTSSYPQDLFTPGINTPVPVRKEKS